MFFNSNNLLIALKYFNTPSIFRERKKITIINEKSVNEWCNLLWNHIIKELNYKENSKNIYRKDFDKFVLYFLNDNEVDKIFNYICNNTNNNNNVNNVNNNNNVNNDNYFTYDSFLNFLLVIHNNDFNKLINSFEKNKN